MGKKVTGKSSLAQQFADLDDPTPKGEVAMERHSVARQSGELTGSHLLDFDPEDDVQGSDSDLASSDGDDEKPDGREHYEAVGYVLRRLRDCSCCGLVCLTFTIARVSYESLPSQSWENNTRDRKSAVTP